MSPHSANAYASTRRASDERKGGKVLAGFVVLQVLRWSLPLLVGAGTFTGAGALLGGGTLVTAGLVARLVAVAPERLPSRGRLLRCTAGSGARWSRCIGGTCTAPRQSK